MNQFEASIILWIQENLRVEVLNGLWLSITRLGDGVIWVALAIVLLFEKKTRPIGLTVLLALSFDYIIVNATLKGLIARPRPFVVNDAILPLVNNVSHYRSFPSGHSGGAFAAMFALYKWVPKKIGVPAMVLAALVAVSRWYVGVHYPTDVLVGSLAGILCGAVAYYLVRMLRNKMEEKEVNG